MLLVIGYLLIGYSVIWLLVTFGDFVIRLFGYLSFGDLMICYLVTWSFCHLVIGYFKNSKNCIKEKE